MDPNRRKRRKNPRNRPPEGEPWIWLTAEMLSSPACRALGINGRRVLDFLMLEHMAHAGTENGRLLAPYNQLVRFGVAKSEISRALAEVEHLGWIDVERGERLGGRQHASRYVLTWLPTADGQPATNRWTKVTENTVREFLYERRSANKLKAARRRERAVLRATGPNKHAGAKILEVVRKHAPENLPNPEPAGRTASSGCKADEGANAGAASVL
ncbi:MAG: hypothetical protein ACT4OG_06395 [Alphaproteobacteria bacterium]